ncbi:acetyl-CoA carboxylase biotin carboxyl carrier protein subunit [Alkalicoccus saliphilus]|jgi:acetyl-CoA carboxylase biotin carboxyl carrier protein|uniref:Acetyl-CoA carboxylase biotin carboxyl carrier protein subunit n=1 Tax=Alkalicoccus saliphilus TaxID=200989 RepID=A0A2T4U6F2_9BACI|nr:acetyl-CoA carboxylase biotin carboxyl carrier protein subunit [Alkalicoccus saliphilus]PTL38970.1 acetyl-CoA carboxylase biotin carboxyl carrier protein subunit [Alkalicoccus saliphilus]
MAKIMTTMAGNVWKINVKVGDQVTPGDEVVILESMKMEIPIAAETEGKVAEILVEEGSFVNEEEVIVKLED